MYRKFIVIAVACLFSGHAWAGVIASKLELTNLLGAGTFIEDFETVNFGAGIPFSGPLNSTTYIASSNGHVNSGLEFSTSSGLLQLDSQYNGPSQALLAIAEYDNLTEFSPYDSPVDLIIDFTDPGTSVTHVGFDFYSWNVPTIPLANIVFEVFDTNMNSLYRSGLLPSPKAAASDFFGFSSSGGIGRIVMENDPNFAFYTPLIDNLTYGSVDSSSVVPIPAALPLFGTGLAIMGFIGWRRKSRTTA